MAPYIRQTRPLPHRRPGVPVSDAIVRSCLSKQRFCDEPVARARAAQILEAGMAEVVRLHVYRCDHCRGWHLTKRAPGAPVVAGNPYVWRS